MKVRPFLFYVRSTLLFLMLVGNGSVFCMPPVQTEALPDTVQFKELIPASPRLKELWARQYTRMPIRQEVLKWMQYGKEGDAARVTLSYPESGGKYERKPIRRIQVRVLEPFGTDVLDPSLKPEGIDKLLNSTHPTTKEKRIREQLLFEEEEALDGELIAQTEYLLRQKPSVYDALIWVRPDETDTSAVWVEVIVKDMFPLGGRVNVSPSRMRLGLYNQNILGYDQRIGWAGYYSPSKHDFGTDIDYSVPNLMGSFFDLDGRFFRNFENKSQHLQVQRLLNKRLSWTGGTVVDWGEKLTPIVRQDTLLWVDRTHWEVWFGYGTRALRGATSLWEVRYSDTRMSAPQPELAGQYAFENRKSLLVRWSYFKESYAKLNYIYRLGKIEDVPVGYGVYGTTGWERSILGNRLYLGAAWQYAQALWGGFGRIELDANVFYHPADRAWQQAAVQSVFSYASPLYYSGNHRVRLLSECKYLTGYLRLPEELLYFSEDDHVRGADRGTASGHQRLLLYNEVDWYLPYKVLGFKMIGFANADIGWVNMRGDSAGQPQVALGVGCRIRNDNLVFNTLQISFSYYPSLSEGSRGRLFQWSGKQVNTFDNFYPLPPSVFEYK